MGGLGPGSEVLFLIQGPYGLQSMLLLVANGLRVLWVYCSCVLYSTSAELGCQLLDCSPPQPSMTSFLLEHICKDPIAI